MVPTPTSAHAVRGICRGAEGRRRARRGDGLSGAKHGFDGGSAYNVPQGENYSRCVFLQQPDGSWKERTSGITTVDAKGQLQEDANKKALAACRTLGVSGGPDPEAKAKSMAALKSYVQRHLLDGK